MLSIYLASLGFGTVLIGVSLLFGGGDKDFDKDVDLDHDHDFDKDLDLDHDHDHDAHVIAEEGSDAIWIPFLSMRFWSFGAMTFGLTGTLMLLSGVPEWTTGMLAGLVGMGIGVGAARFFRALKKDTVTAETSLRSYTGEEARVLLPIRQGGTGKIVIETMAGRVEMPATSRDTEIIPRGAKVIVAEVRDGTADVSALATLSNRHRQKNAQRHARAKQTEGRG